MRRGSTIIPLYDPTDWERPLPECLPAADNAYVDIGPHRRASLMSLQIQSIINDDRTLEPDENSVSELSCDSDRIYDQEEDLLNTWTVPPRRKRHPNQPNYLSTLQHHSLAIEHSPIPSQIIPPIPSPKAELLNPLGAVDSTAVYKSIFKSEPPISKRGSRSSEEIPPFPRPLALTPEVKSPAKLSVSSSPAKKDVKGSSSTPSSSSVTVKKKPIVEKEPIYMDPQVCSAPFTIPLLALTCAVSDAVGP